MQVVIQLFCHEVIYEILHGNTAFGHVLTTQFGLGLGFEHRLHYPYRNGGCYALADIGSIIIFLIEVTDDLYKCLAKRLLMGSALGGILSVDKTEYLLPVITIMSNGNLDVFPFKMDDGVTQ